MENRKRTDFNCIYIWLSIYLSLSAFLLVILFNENTPEFIVALSLFLFAVFVVQLGVIVALVRYSQSVAFRYAIISLMIACNIYTLYVTHLDLAIYIEISVFFILIVLSFATLYFSRLNAGVLVFIVIAAIAFPVSSILTSSFSESSPNSTHVEASVAKYSGVKFGQKPNVYLISFDAMIPEAIANKYLDLKDISYEKALRDENALILTNGFVADAPSIPSLNAVMKLDDRENFQGNDYVSGLKNSPLAQIFRENGYELETGASIPFYFGRQGPFVDSYLHAPKNFITDSTLCKFASARDAVVAAFGFCTLAKFVTTKALLDVAPVIANSAAPYFDSEWFDLVLSRIGRTDAKGPRIGFYYVYYPVGHAPNDYITGDQKMFSEYRDRFVIQSKKAAEVVTDIQRHVEKTDPNSIVMIFGDHGAKISRTVDREQFREFWVQDNYAVLISILDTENTCARPDLGVYNKTFSTAGRVVASVIRCLSVNPDRLDQAANFGGAYDFDDFLYE